MLRYIYADQLHLYPRLARSMFQDRARQFRDRLDWNVTVHPDGAERDEYDLLNPLYVIWEDAHGRHGGSMRFLPTTGATMINDHFLSLMDGTAIRSPSIWECTRFCLAPDALPQVSAALMLGGMELGLGADLSHAVGVFDARMIRIYRRLGWGPIILGTEGHGREAISVGLWAFESEIRPRLLARAGVSSEVSKAWHARAFDEGSLRPMPLSA